MYYYGEKKIKPTLVSHDAISQVIDGDMSSSSDFWLSHPFANQMPVEHFVHQTRHLHKWPSVMATHTILREHEPEDWEKDMRRGLPLEKCIYNISIPYCCRHFFPPKTTRHCSASQLQIYMDIWPSIFRPYASGTLCINRKEDITISAFTNWFAGLHKKNAICGIVIFFYLQNQEILALLLRIFVWAYKSYKNDMTLKRWL